MKQRISQRKVDSWLRFQIKIKVDLNIDKYPLKALVLFGYSFNFYFLKSFQIIKQMITCEGKWCYLQIRSEYKEHQIHVSCACESRFVRIKYTSLSIFNMVFYSSSNTFWQQAF